MITKFKIFEKIDNEGTLVSDGRYLNLEKLDNGDLKIILTPDGREEIEDSGEVNFDDLFEDIRCNSDYLYWESMSDAELGMSDAPCITDGYYFEDNGDLLTYDDSELFYYPDYMIKDFKEELDKDGFVIFITNSPKTLEEIEKHRFERKVKKYNL